MTEKKTRKKKLVAEVMQDGGAIVFEDGETRLVECCKCGLVHAIRADIDGKFVVTHWTRKD